MTHLRWAQALASLVVLALAQGCATRPLATSPEALAAWSQHRSDVGGIQRFTLQGRFAAGGIFGTKGQVFWAQIGEDYQVRLWGPFGAGAIQLSGNQNQAEIRSADETLQTTDPERELRHRFGWTLPVGQLRWWVLGVPAPTGKSGLQLDDQGRLLALEQAGWTLEYQEYQLVDGRQLPRKLALANDEFTLKLVVDQWSELGDAP